MKRVKSTYVESLGPVKLFLNDVEEIVSILREVSATVDIRTDEYSMESVEELKKLDVDCIHELTIQCREPYVSLELDRYRIWLYIAEDTPVSRGLFEKVKEVLVRRRRRLARILRNPSLIWVPLGLLIYPIVIGLRLSNWSLLALGLFLLISICIWGRWAWVARFERYSTIVLRRQSEHKSFWERNKDQLLLSVISAIIGGVITYVFTILLRKSP